MMNDDFHFPLFINHNSNFVKSKICPHVLFTRDFSITERFIMIIKTQLSELDRGAVAVNNHLLHPDGIGFEVLSYEVPVHELFQVVRDVSGAHVLVVKVVSVLPHCSEA